MALSAGRRGESGKRVSKTPAIRGARAVEIRCRWRLLAGVLARGRGGIEHEREHAVQKPRIAVERRDVAIERGIAAAEPQRLLGRGEQGADDAGQRPLDVGGAGAQGRV